MQGIVFDIQRYSTHDGPGIRTTVFLKGCSLRCFWCHNPESIGPRPQLLFTRAKCIACGRCVQSCPNGAVCRPGEIDAASCTACGVCEAACPPGALKVSGRSMTVEEVVREAEKDQAFYRKSEGGVTLSGGEALLQSAFAAAFLAKCMQKGWHTAVDTAGDVPFSAFEEVLPYTRLFLYDIKAADSAPHKQGTGADNRRILDNLRKLSERGANIRLRVPVIPGFNSDEGEMERIGEIVRGLPGTHGLDLLRFHRMGAIKYDSLRQPYRAADLTPLDDTRMQTLANALKPYCNDVQIQ